jgi:hypothetical protein
MGTLKVEAVLTWVAVTPALQVSIWPYLDEAINLTRINL